MFLYSYKFGSASAKVLGEHGIKRIKHKGSKFKGHPNKVVLNWGSSVLPPEVLKCHIINKPENVALAANKLKTFNSFSAFAEGADKGRELYYPEYTTEKAVASDWLAQGATIVERHKLTGNSGDGIVITEPGNELGDAKMYTKYVPKKEEYRVHTFDGQPILIQRKARVKDVPDDQVDWKVRNMAGGFIFAKNEDKVVPPMVAFQAALAVEALGLDFGAVDVIYNDKKQMAYVLEVNTAPGLGGTTVDKYLEVLDV